MVDPEKQRTATRVLTWLLAAALLLSIVAVAYVAVTPNQTTNPYTEFYVLDGDGTASDYGTDMTVGVPEEFVLGVSNNENQDMTYTVAFVLDGELIGEETITVDRGETWEDDVTCTVAEAGEYELEILLFVGEDVGDVNDAYRDLRLQLSANDAESTTVDSVDDCS